MNETILSQLNAARNLLADLADLAERRPLPGGVEERLRAFFAAYPDVPNLNSPEEACAPTT